MEQILKQSNGTGKSSSLWSFFNNDRGMSLITSLGFMAIIAILGAVAVTTTTFNSGIAGKFKRDQIAFYNAEAGLEFAKYQLCYSMSALGQTATQILTANKNTTTSLMPDSSSTTAILAAPANAAFPKFVSNPSFNGGSYSVYVSNDVVEGLTTTTDSNNTLTLTSVGYGPSSAVAVVQAVCTLTVTSAGTNVTSMGGAVSMLGNSISFDFGNSNAESINGGTVADIAASTLTGITIPKNGTPQIRTASAPFDTPEHLQTYYAQLKTASQAAGNYYNGNNLIIPNLSNPHNTPVVVNGDYTLASGSGILVVTGTLTIGNNVNWDGLILVVGKGILNRKNGGEINGAIVVGSIVGNIDAGTGITGAWGLSKLTGTNGGGTATWTYDPSKWSGVSQSSTPSSATITKTSWKQAR